jgi:hypothetical protein
MDGGVGTGDGRRCITPVLQHPQSGFLGRSPVFLAKWRAGFHRPVVDDLRGLPRRLLARRPADADVGARDRGARTFRDRDADHRRLRLRIQPDVGGRREIAFGGRQFIDLFGRRFHHEAQLVGIDVVAVAVTHQVEVRVQQVAQGLGRIELDLVDGMGRHARQHKQHAAGHGRQWLDGSSMTGTHFILFQSVSLTRQPAVATRDGAGGMPVDAWG